MKRWVIILLLIIVPAVFAQEKPTVFYEIGFVPREYALNVRSSPGHSSPNVDTLQNGQPIDIVDATHEDGWVQIRYDDKDGWIERRFLSNFR